MRAKPNLISNRIARPLERMVGMLLPGRSPIGSAHRPINGYSLSLLASILDMGDFSIDYSMGSDKKVALWSPVCNECVHITVLKADTGAGKSSLLLQIYRYIRDSQAASLAFDFDPDMAAPQDVIVAFLPQKSPIIRHWKVSELVPCDSIFTKALLDEHNDSSALLTRRLGELSGGQCMRVYVASALERLVNSSAHAAFLLLDEILDGVGEENKINQYLTKIKDLWRENSPGKPLHLLLVSHKQIGPGYRISNAQYVGMNVLERDRDHLKVLVRKIEDL